MAFRIKKVPGKTPEPILSGEEESASFSVRYPLEDLRRLKQLQDRTRVSAREWFRALLGGLLEAYERRGSIELPLYVVSRADAERFGLLQARQQQPEASSNQ
jgi:hypothetical protein